MFYKLSADLVLLLHLGFILFVLFGGLAAYRWRIVIWLHLPAVVWGSMIELAGWYCPLTPLEQSLRLAAGEAGYTGGFIEHYLVPIIYPSGLTREIQFLSGVIVILVNIIIYVQIYRKRRRGR